jgi:DnaJ-class molecular chaperone
MLLCNHCHGSGFATCPECDGLGHVQELRGSGELEDHVCSECNGRRSARCDACGGIGWLGADNVIVLPVEFEAAEADLPRSYRDEGRPELAAIDRLVSGDW